MPNRPSHNRHAFTLIELLLVLVLLVVIGGMAVAVFDGSVLRARLDEGAEVVGAAWTDARTRAISSGNRVVFTCQLGGAEYRLSAANDLAQSEEQLEGATELGELPEGVVFRAVQAAPRDSMAAGTAMLAGATGDWASPIVFDPDGSSYDAVLILESESGQQVELTLRGLTATSTVRRLLEGEYVQ